VDKLGDDREQKAKCRDAQNGLAARIAEYRPLAIVSLLKSIRKNVDAAAIAAGSGARRLAVSFRGNGQQKKFLAEMQAIIPTLPRLPDVI